MAGIFRGQHGKGECVMTRNPKDAVTKAANATDEVIEVVGHIPAAILATWGMTEGEVRLILPGEPISG
jgi:hypothetical protein